MTKTRLLVIVPLAKHHAENVRGLREEIFGGHGLSVVIARRECIQTLRHKKGPPSGTTD